jgi:hypothetical protein
MRRRSCRRIPLLQAWLHTLRRGMPPHPKAAAGWSCASSSSRVVHPGHTSLRVACSRLHSLPPGWGGLVALQRAQNSIEDGMAVARVARIPARNKSATCVYGIVALALQVGLGTSRFERPGALRWPAGQRLSAAFRTLKREVCPSAERPRERERRPGHRARRAAGSRRCSSARALSALMVGVPASTQGDAK